MSRILADPLNEGARAAAIKDAAIRLFGERGFAATGIRDIAKEAGINAATLYHYMANKEELLYGLVVECISRLMTPIDNIANEIVDPRERISHLVRLHVQFHCESAAMSMVADTELRSLTGVMRERAIAERDRYEAVWLQVILDGQASGDFQIGNPRVTVQALLGMCTSVYTWYDPSGPMSIRAIAEEHRLMTLRLCGASSVR